MNEEQFNITKLMQEMHIPAEKWAKATDESPHLMRSAYNAPNYQVFMGGFEETVRKIFT